MRYSPRLLALAAVLGMAACAEEAKFKKARADMTQRERDSTIAASGLPGSGVVKKAMSIADAQADRSAMFDSVGAQ